MLDNPSTHTQGPEANTLALFGGNGATGIRLLRTALDKGIRVQTLVRNTSSIDLKSDKIHIIEGSTLDPDAVRNSLCNCNVVICVFGPRPPYADIFCADATRIIIEAMHDHGIKRIVCQTGSMVGAYHDNLSLPFKYMVSIFNKRLSGIANDRTAQEGVVMTSSLSWTIVKPPRLTDKKAKGKWIAGEDVQIGMFSSVGHSDLASFLLQETYTPEFTCKTVFIKG